MRVSISNQCNAHFCSSGVRTLQEPLASRVVLHMAEEVPQNQKILGYYRDAVRVQIYSSICPYCLVAIDQHDMQLERTTYKVLQILSISLADKTHLQDLFDKTKFQNDKERFEPNGPSLFNY